MSSDPLASVITQVQPGQGAPHGRGPGPARPTKVAKPGTAKAAAQQQATSASGGAAASSEIKKKKKKKVKRKVNPDGTTTSTAPAAATSSSSQPAGSSTIAAPTSDPQHSAQPSSTLAGSVTPLSDTAEVGATPGAVGVGETDAAAKLQSPPTHEQDMTMAAQTLQTSAEDPPSKSAISSAPSVTAHKGDPPSSTVKSSSATTSTSPKGTNAASSPAKAKKKKSPMSKLIASLTCSTGAATMAADEKKNGNGDDGEQIEMREGTSKSRIGASGAKGKNQASAPGSSSALPASKSGKSVRGRNRNSKGGPGAAYAGSKAESTTRLAPPIKTRPGRSGSRSSSARNSLDRRSETGVVAPAPGAPTAGGGTMLSREETGDVMSGAVVPPGSSFVTPDSKRGSAMGTPSKRGSARGDSDAEDGDSDDEEGSEEEEVTDEETDEEDDTDGMNPDYIDDDEISEEQRLIAQGGMGIPRDEFGNEHPLLPVLGAPDHGRKCLVLDLDETLVHSSFKMITNADFIVPVEIEGTVHNVYVIKRPGVDEFMRRMGEIYEVVVFTASLSKYADPVLDILDIHRVVRHRLFRESCYNHRGNYVKDLSQLGRPISESIIIDNSPASYIFHPNNAVPISSWFNDPHDTELTDLCPFLADLSEVGDVRAVLDGGL